MSPFLLEYAEHMNIYICTDVPVLTLDSGGGRNTVVCTRLVVWKWYGKIADKPKPMSKVWDSNRQQPDQSTYESGN